MLVSIAVTLLLRLSQHQIGPTIYISTVLLSCGAILIWIIGIIDDYSHLPGWIKWLIKVGAAFIFPIEGLCINSLYGICGIGQLSTPASVIITVVLTIATIQATSTITRAKRPLCGILVSSLLFLLGMRFFVLGCYTYAYLAFTLLGALIIALYYKHSGDACIGSIIRIGTSGTLVLGFALSYLLLKLAMDNPKVIHPHADVYDGYVIAASLAIILILLFLPIVRHYQKEERRQEQELLPQPDEAIAGQNYEGEPGLVSVIMATYNSRLFVSESIQSVLNQTYKNLELIITDDASRDGTPELLKEWAKKDPRVHIILNTENGGAGRSRNCSIRAARGQYIAFCDSDDRWVPEKLEQQVGFMQQHNIALCFAPYYTCDAHNHYLGYVSAPRRVTLFQMMCDNKIGFLTAIYDTRHLGRHLMPPQRKRQDHALLLTMMRKCKFAYSVQEPLAHYRIHAGNMSGSKMGLLKYNARTYNAVFGWPMPLCYAFLFAFFLPNYFWKRTKNIFINIFRTKLG